MATGKILRFDEIRGYGFIAPDSGGEDVFLHANALLAEKHQYQPGVPVEFDVIEGERGLKATAVRVLKNRPVTTPAAGTPVPAASPTSPSPSPVAQAIVKPVPSPAVQAPATHGPAAQPQSSTPGAPAAQPHTTVANGSSLATAAPPVVTPATVAAATGVVPPTPQTGSGAQPGSPAIAPQRSANDSKRTVREVVTPDVLGSELVELCLESVPSMTGEQITQLRRAMVAMARRHGWLSETA